MRFYVKQFFYRGLLFGGFGPLVLGIIYAVLQGSLPSFSLAGDQVLLAIVSTYLLAFVQAGASVFPRIETLPPALATLYHFLCLYAAYLGCYLLNTWIPFDPMVVVIFSGIFLASYLVVWCTVYVCVRVTERRLNARLATAHGDREDDRSSSIG